MQKSLLLLTLLVLSTILLCACLGNEEISSTVPSLETETEALSTQSVDISETEETTVDTGYTLIEPNEPTSYSAICFAAENRSYGLSLNLPSDWQFENRSKNVIIIKKNNDEIGTIAYESKSTSDEWLTLTSSKHNADKISIEFNVEKHSTAEEYRHRICFNYNEDGEAKAVTLTVPYCELSNTSLMKIKLYTAFKNIGYDPQIGVIDLESDTRGVLIMGNSFIGTSKVGDILDEMIRRTDKKISVTSLSRGYAHVDTYALDNAIMALINSGEYSAVFICGFYDNDQVEYLSMLKEACDNGKTALFIFPAHNENAASIKRANKSVEGVQLLNWKEQIESFIDRGADKWSFCYDDQHLHSTPLAGYIGAHMIYRAIFGEIPDCTVSKHVSQSLIDSVLGNYAQTGIAYKVKTPIYFFD